MSREDLERAVIEAAVEWVRARNRGGLGLISVPTQALVAAVEALNNAPTPTAYEDRDGDVWYESRESPGHWCVDPVCRNPTNGYDRSLDDARRHWGPLKEVPDDRV